MSRTEFPAAIKRAAKIRSGGLCEAIGSDYGLAADRRCNGSLSGVVQYDHVNPDGLTGKPTLENCAAVCPKCHSIKTRTVDVPRIAQAKRREDRQNGIRKPSRMAGARNSKFKQKIGGGVILRATGEEIGR